jgi:hypothetical protein
MDFQGAPLNKTLVAILDSTRVWSLVGMDAVMSVEVCSAGKGLVTLSMDMTRREILYHLIAMLPRTSEPTCNACNHDRSAR